MRNRTNRDEEEMGLGEMQKEEAGEANVGTIRKGNCEGRVKNFSCL